MIVVYFFHFNFILSLLFLNKSVTSLAESFFAPPIQLIDFIYLVDPQIGVVSSWPDTAICVRNVDVLCVCNSHLFSGLAPFFIDPRA